MSIFLSIKKLFQHSAVYGMGHILNRLITFLLIPLYTNTFDKEPLGVYTLVFSYIAILTIIYSYGLDTAFFRFYIIDESQEGRKRIFSTAFWTILITSILFSWLIYFYRAPLTMHLFSAAIQQLGINLPNLISWSAAILLFDSLSLMPFLILRAEEKPLPFILYKFLNVILNFVVNMVLIVKFRMGIEGIFIANFISSIATFILMLPICLKHFRFMFSWATFRDLFAFGLPYLPATLSVNLMDTIDKIILEKLDSVEVVGLYGPSARLGMFMALFITAFRFAWHPFFLSTSKQENAKQVFTKVFTYVILACTVVFLFFSLFIDDIVRLKIGKFSLMGPEYWQGTVVVPIIFIAYIFYAAYLNFIIGIYLEKKTTYLPFITGAGIVANVIGLYTLIPRLGFVGAAWARVFAYFVMATALYMVGQKLYRIDYEWTRLIKLTLLTAACFFIGRIHFPISPLMFKLLIFLLFPVALRVFGFFEKSEVQTWRTLFKRLSLKKP